MFPKPTKKNDCNFKSTKIIQELLLLSNRNCIYSTFQSENKFFKLEIISLQLQATSIFILK